MLDTCLSPVARVFLPPRCCNDASRYFSRSLSLSISLSQAAALRILRLAYAPPLAFLACSRLSLSAPSCTVPLQSSICQYRISPRCASAHPPPDSLAKIPPSEFIPRRRKTNGRYRAVRNTFLESPRIEIPGLVNQREYKPRTFILSSCY